MLHIHLLYRFTTRVAIETLVFDIKQQHAGMKHGIYKIADMNHGTYNNLLNSKMRIKKEIKKANMDCASLPA
jgi:hypothetical protein